MQLTWMLQIYIYICEAESCQTADLMAFGQRAALQGIESQGCPDLLDPSSTRTGLDTEDIHGHTLFGEPGYAHILQGRYHLLARPAVTLTEVSMTSFDTNEEQMHKETLRESQKKRRTQQQEHLGQKKRWHLQDMFQMDRVRCSRPCGGVSACNHCRVRYSNELTS